jgi:molybdopterin/thiamine biosynthesis adenylyltransferase
MGGYFYKYLPYKNTYMNCLVINNKTYRLPNDEDTLTRVINHLDMVRLGVKDYIKLFDLENNSHKLSKTYLNNSEIKILRGVDSDSQKGITYVFEIIDGEPCARIYKNGEKLGVYVNLIKCSDSEIPDSVKEDYQDFLNKPF